MAVPAMFSEQICRKLLRLKSIKGKEVDALDDDGKKYEIKATTKSTGTTTINVKQSAEYLIWIYFDFDAKKIIIRKTCYDNARKIIKTDKNERDTIVLSNVNSWKIMKEVDMDSLATVLRRKKEAAVSSKRKVKNK